MAVGDQYQQALQNVLCPVLFWERSGHEWSDAPHLDLAFLSPGSSPPLAASFPSAAPFVAATAGDRQQQQGLHSQTWMEAAAERKKVGGEEA
eukprot:1158450-Pelagomonas_calceolata.AAC.1